MANSDDNWIGCCLIIIIIVIIIAIDYVIKNEAGWVLFDILILFLLLCSYFYAKNPNRVPKSPNFKGRVNKTEDERRMDRIKNYYQFAEKNHREKTVPCNWSDSFQKTSIPLSLFLETVKIWIKNINEEYCIIGLEKTHTITAIYACKRSNTKNRSIIPPLLTIIHQIREDCYINSIFIIQNSNEIPQIYDSLKNLHLNLFFYRGIHGKLKKVDEFFYPEFDPKNEKEIIIDEKTIEYCKDEAFKKKFNLN